MSTDNSDRRSRIVMALGVVTIILFSANLLTVLAQHFWPDDAEVAFFESRAIAEDAAGVGHVEIDVDVRSDAPRKHRIVMHFPKQSSQVHVDGIDAEIAEMERAAHRLERELNRELAKLNSEEIQFEVARAIEVERELVSGRRIALQITKELGEVIELELDQNMVIESDLDSDMENEIQLEMKSTIEKIKRDLERSLKDVEEASDAEVSRVVIRKRDS